MQAVRTNMQAVRYRHASGQNMQAVRTNNASGVRTNMQAVWYCHASGQNMQAAEPICSIYDARVPYCPSSGQNMQAGRINMQAVWILMQAVRTCKRAENKQAVQWRIQELCKRGSNMQAVRYCHASDQNMQAAEPIIMQYLWCTVKTCKREESICKRYESWCKQSEHASGQRTSKRLVRKLSMFKQASYRISSNYRTKNN